MKLQRNTFVQWLGPRPSIMPKWPKTYLMSFQRPETQNQNLFIADTKTCWILSFWIALQCNWQRSCAVGEKIWILTFSLVSRCNILVASKQGFNTFPTGCWRGMLNINYWYVFGNCPQNFCTFTDPSGENGQSAKVRTTVVWKVWAQELV